MKKFLKIVWIIATIIILWIVALNLFVSYMVNTWKSNTESIQEDDYYKKLDKLNETSYIIDSDLNILSIFISTANANSDEYILSENTKKLLEKYYILGHLDMSKIPDEVFSYWRLHWKEMPNILNSYDYLNKTKTLDQYIKLKTDFNNKKFYNDTINNELINIIESYFKNKKIQNELTFLPSDIQNDDNYKFMINGLKNHKFLVSNSKKLWKELEFDYNLTLAAILTEQFRYAWTYRWYVKSYLTKTPFIFTMTQFSNWVGWIKDFTGDKIYDDAVLYWYWKVFDAQKTDVYKNYTRTQLLQNTYWETVYPNILIKNIITRWDKAEYSISDKPWIILTLYNFWNPSDKKPHWNPKIGWAVIKLNENENRKYTFGWLWEALFYYIKVYSLY